MSASALRDRRLLQLGALLFLLGLLAGIATPVAVHPRLGLAAHVEGVLNGLFLIALGLIWPRLALPDRALTITYWLALYGTYANLGATGLAAVTGAAHMMPIAGGGLEGSSLEEGVMRTLLVSLSLAMLAVCGLVIVGLRGTEPVSAGTR